MKSKGEWEAGGRVVKNNLTQAAFNLIGSFFASPNPARPASIALAASNGEIFATRAASFSYVPSPSGLGVVIEGVATFSSGEVAVAAHEVALVDSSGQVLAEAPLDPPIAAGSTVTITRRDIFTEA